MLLAQALSGSQASVTWEERPLGGPLDPRWYEPLGSMSRAGVMVTANTALNCGTVLAALRFLANSVAVCQSKVFVELGPDRRREDREHYLHRALRSPNAWQNGYRWRHQMLVWAALWGNAHNQIVPGRDAVVGELRPLHPSRVRVLDQMTDGSLLYGYRNPKTSREEKLSQSEVLHFRGVGRDGMSGDPIYTLMQNVVGIALAAERHVASFLRKGTRLSGVLSTPNVLTQDQRDLLKETWNQAWAGTDNVGRVAVVESDLKFTPMSPDNVKAQMLELRDFQVGEILRVLGVPGVVVGHAEKTATYASAEAFFEKGGIKHCVLPWVTNLEEEIDDSLISENDPHYVKFNLDILMRANTKDRYEALYRACGGPWLSRNEVRRIEDLNPDPDPGMSEVLTPSNMMAEMDEEPPEPSTPTPPPQAPPPPPPDEEDEETAARRLARAEEVALEAAGRVVRREIAAIRGSNGTRGAAIRYARDPAGWQRWVEQYYRKHATHLAQTLRLPEEAARSYAERQKTALLAEGVAIVETWEDTVSPQLAALALEA